MTTIRVHLTNVIISTLFILLGVKAYSQCTVDVTNSMLHNPSFEEWQNDPYNPSGYYNFCPNCPDPNNQLCSEYAHSNVWLADYWHPGTDYGTTDYYNPNCTVTMSDMAAMPNSVRNNPDGDGFIGFIVSNQYLEYASTCPITPFLANQQYSITFSIAGFYSTSGGDACSRTPAPAHLAIYGRTTCPSGQSGDWYEQPTFLLNGDQGCFLQPPYILPPTMQLLTTATYTPSPNWSTITFTFTPTVNINYIAIGGQCGSYTGYDVNVNNNPCYPYIVLDGMRVTRISCNDNDACTTDACVNSQCTHTAIVCNDNKSCTTDRCVNGSCVYTSNCSDLNPCTIDQCTSSGCVYTPRDCNDNDGCTRDGCSGGNCYHNPISCSDGNSCTTDVCINSICVYTPVSCNDNNVCTTDQCINSNCVFTLILCNDNNPCTTNWCIPATGCEYRPVICNDNNPCTIDICSN